MRLSALDEPYPEKPEVHIWVQSVASWETLPDDGAERYPQGAPDGMKPAYLLDLGVTPYDEAWALQRSLAAPCPRAPSRTPWCSWSTRRS